MPRYSLIALAAVCLASAPVSAQPVSGDSGVVASSTKGFFIGAHVNSTGLTSDDLSDDNESGPGAGLQIGYGFTRRLALVLDGTAARIDSQGDKFTLAHFDISIRYAFTSPTRRVVPYLSAGFSGRNLGFDDVTLDSEDPSSPTGDLSLSGTGFTFGGGLQYYATPKIALGVGLKWTTGEFDTVKFDDVSVDGLGIDATSARINLGLTWYPMGGR